MSKINGGATLWARQTVDSDIFYNKPDKWFKIWFYLINEVNHKDNKQFKRGSCFMRYEWIMQKTKATKHEVGHCIKWLKSATMIATAKATRGFTLKVLNYNGYQSLENYKSDSKSDSKSDLKAIQKRYRSDTINKNEKNGKNDKNKEKEKSVVFLKVWEEYKNMRTKLRKPMTPRAEELIINELNKLADNEAGQVAILNQSIMNSWQGVFPLKGTTKDGEFEYKKHESKRVSKEEAERYKDTAREGIKKLIGRGS